MFYHQFFVKFALPLPWTRTVPFLLRKRLIAPSSTQLSPERPGVQLSGHGVKRRGPTWDQTLKDNRRSEQVSRQHINQWENSAPHFCSPPLSLSLTLLGVVRHEDYHGWWYPVLLTDAAELMGMHSPCLAPNTGHQPRRQTQFLF